MPDTPVAASRGRSVSCRYGKPGRRLGADRPPRPTRAWSGSNARFDAIDRRFDALSAEHRSDFRWLLGVMIGRLCRDTWRLRRHARRDGTWVPLAVGRRRPSHRRRKTASRLAAMDWDAPAIVLDARPYGEGDAIATVMTEEHGAHRGLARGGACARPRRRSGSPATSCRCAGSRGWPTNSAASARNWCIPAAALAMDDPLALAMLSAACAVAEGRAAGARAASRACSRACCT